ncbi:hypothetical protein ACELLULO517_27510 [Acidisoma cellulosilytica]|uniref:Uncharacterized protein n=1 Tax=Acidisoma cellulosilyticum TaxID=2802395 RepID=A0A963Z6Y6_9PROT|nr:E2 domain-associated cysteine-rich protein [Acidisoma cellulosilyticum]MCB8884014.1 hypothetical protein [Acidisoma cellulosilyticum]
MTGTLASTIDTLAACLPALGATELGRGSGGELDVALPVTLSDGRCPVYHLRVSAAGASASASEVTPTLLPTFCPERHINVDGSFCLYWRPIDDIVIDGPSSAMIWWETLVRFLQLQTRAARRRHWPDGHGRAHGAAAIHQFRAERAAERLGDPLFTDMRDGRLSVVMHGSGAEGPGIRVLRDGQRVFATWLRSRRVVNLRRPCLCTAGQKPRPRVIRSCGDHAAAAARLALELHKMAEQERDFWKDFEGHPCCGTMDDCPLAQKSIIEATRVAQPEAV